MSKGLLFLLGSLLLLERAAPKADCLRPTCLPLSSQAVLLPARLSPASALRAYVAKKDRAYRWRVVEKQEMATGTYYYLTVVSQQWRGMQWQHPLALFFPHQAVSPHTMLLALRHLEQQGQDRSSLQVIAQQTGSPCAFLYGVPNQPLFDGKQEDELLNYTFLEFLKTGEETWPLLLPMVKSVVKAMDALQAISRQESQPVVDGFLVTGHSKRGHTAWLTAAIDSRVKAIMPVAFDLLNAKAQIPHHLAVFGHVSTSAQAGKSVLEQIETPRGQALLRMVDAFNYLKDLTLPKLIVLGTNDDYSPTDALNMYWEGLPGPKWILYLPNTDHVGASLAPQVNATAFAFLRAVASGKSLPAMQWHYRENSGALTLRIQTDATARSARLWSAVAPTPDFRSASWQVHTMAAREGKNTAGVEFLVEVKKPASGYLMLLGEVEYDQQGNRFTLSTQTKMVSAN